MKRLHRKLKMIIAAWFFLDNEEDWLVVSTLRLAKSL